MNQSQFAAEFLNCKHFIRCLNLWPLSAMAAPDASPPAKRRRRGVVPEKSPNEAWRFCQARCGELRWVEASVHSVHWHLLCSSFFQTSVDKSQQNPQLTGLTNDHHVEKQSKDKFSYRWMLGCNFHGGGLRCQGSFAKVCIRTYISI